MHADACVFSVVKKMNERFVLTTRKKAKVREVGLEVLASEQSQIEV